MADLSTRYLGLTLRNPIVVGSSGLTDAPDKVQALEAHGAGAVVLKSIFEEEISLEYQQALREAAQVVSALPGDLAARVDFVSVATIDQIELTLRDGRTVMWGSAEDSEQKAAVLARLLKQPAKHYDVSVPGNATTSN